MVMIVGYQVLMEKTKYYLIKEDLYQQLTGDSQIEETFEFKYFY